MKLGIMQPYFFPYLGYFDLIHYTDQWIVFDTVQYIRHGWINRNRILHPHTDWQYIVVPLQKHTRETPIIDIQIAGQENWRVRILGQLEHYHKRAPYFKETISLVQRCLGTSEHSISRLNISILAQVCQHLDISFHCLFFSELKLEMGPVTEPGDWALRISEAFHASEYVNPPGGAGLFDVNKFKQSGVRLTIRNLPPFEYSCPGYTFVPHLSIIDLLMWNEPQVIKAYLDQQRGDN